MAAAPTLTPAALATELGTDPRTARKFLRSITPKENHPGKGARWEIKGTKTEITRLQKSFRAFTEAQEKAKNDRENAKNENAPAEVIAKVSDLLHEATDSLDALDGPSDDEMTEAMLNEAHGV